MTNYLGIVYNYGDTGYDLTHAPKDSPTTIETPLTIYYVSSDAEEELWKYTIATGSDELIETRDQKIQGAYHDRDNGIIYFIDCDNDGVSVQTDCWYLTISNDNVSEMGTITPGGIPGWEKAWDIYKWGSDFFALITWNNGDHNETAIYKWNDPNWDWKDGNTSAEVTTTPGYFTETTIAAVNYLVFTQDWVHVDDVILMKYRDDTTTLSVHHTISDTSHPSSRNMLGIAYDNSDFLYLIVNLDADGLNYLYTYEISTSTMTQIGEYNIALMLDRNNNTSNNIPFNLEKAFDISLDSDNKAKIYKISTRKGNLYAISQISLSSGDLIVAITDTYLIVDRTGSGGDVDVYKYVDFSSYVLGRSVMRAIQRNYWQCEMYVRTTGALGDYNIFDGMFIQIIGNLSAQCNTGTLSYFGAPDNFNDEVVGTEGTSIAFVDSATLYDGELIIVDEWQSHKNLLRLQDDATGGENPTFTHNMTASTASTIELYVGTDDVTELWYFGLYDSSVPDFIVQLRITASKLYYYDSGDAWQEIQAVANDTFYHVKIIWRADNTFDVYVDETIKVTNQATNNNQSSGVDNFVVSAEGDSTDYLYIDAWGNIANANYYVGRNLIKTKEDAVIYEGYARYSDLKDPRKIWIDSPALRDLKNKIFPGSYSGRTDQILSSIFDDSFNYITAGTMSNGAAMGTQYFRGSKKGKRIIDNYAQIDEFSWNILPDDGQGILNYDDGSNSSYVKITEGDKIRWISAKKIRDIVNCVHLRGAINPATGKPFEATYNNTASQKIYGVQPVFRTYAQIADQTILDNLAQSIATVAALAPFQYIFSKKADFEGLVSPLETINFAYSPESINAANRIIYALEYYFRTGIIKWNIIDSL